MASRKGLAALLVGVAIGAGIGLLFAPEKGEITRGKIRGGLRARRDDLLEKIAALYGQMNMPFSPSSILESDFEADAEEVSREMVDKLEEKFRELKDAAGKLGDQ
ncbi:MAG TPA: YtxH domain-containing protein [Flavobacterium sp.]|jgi:gas vesicle protein